MAKRIGVISFIALFVTIVSLYVLIFLLARPKKYRATKLDLPGVRSANLTDVGLISKTAKTEAESKNIDLMIATTRMASGIVNITMDSNIPTKALILRHYTTKGYLRKLDSTIPDRIYFQTPNTNTITEAPEIDETESLVEIHDIDIRR